MKQIAFIGEYEVVTGFKPFGVDTFASTDPEKVKEIFSVVISRGYKMIFISETVLEFIQEQVEEYFIKPFPVITIVPGLKIKEEEKEPETKDKVINIIERTIGTNLLRGEN